MLIDISTPLQNGMHVWKGDPPAKFEQVMFMDRGDMCNVTRMNIGAHTGTHMDAPRHFLADGAAIETLPLEAVIGPARVVAVDDPTHVRAQYLETLGLKGEERILFKTRNSDHAWEQPEFYEHFVAISMDGAQYLAEKGIRTVGVDYLSVAGYHDDLSGIHQTILRAGIWIIEGLRLAHVEPGEYELICLPMKIVGSDGAPARAVLRTL